MTKTTKKAGPKKSPKAAEEISKQVRFAHENVLRKLSGNEHDVLREVASTFGIRVGARGDVLNLRGAKAAVERAQELITHLGQLAMQDRQISLGDIRHAALRMSREGKTKAEEYFSATLFSARGQREICPRGPGQRAYVKAMRENDLVISVGPAGTGKTYLAMTMAVSELMAERVGRIILTRPAVEAGERLGFLPGTLQEKVSPYLRPLYDALSDLLGAEKAEQLVAHGTVEVAPLAFMRGRTLNDAFVILDEAQNTKREQMKMFLTRLGFGSKMVVTGDITQIDLEAGVTSGLIEAVRVLDGVPGIAVMRLTEKDVVRHPLVQSVVQAYEASAKG